MKLRVIAKDEKGNPSDLNLIKEKRKMKYNETFQIKDPVRAKEILNTTFKENPVVEIVEENKK